MPSKISHAKTLEAIEDVAYNNVNGTGLNILLKRSADQLSIVNNVRITILSGKRKLVEEYIKTLLLDAKKPISTVVEIAQKSHIIFIPLKDSLGEGTEAILSYRESGRDFFAKFKL